MKIRATNVVLVAVMGMVMLLSAGCCHIHRNQCDKPCCCKSATDSPKAEKGKAEQPKTEQSK